MDSKIKKLVAGVALTGALTAGTAGVAFAADGSTSSTAPSAQTTRRHPLIRLEIRRGVVKVVTDTLGVSREELRDALKSGQTLSEYTTSLGKDPQTVVDALTNAATTKLDQLVADGTIKQERADTIKSKLPERIDTLMNHQFGQHATA
jgi:ribosomal protein S20